MFDIGFSEMMVIGVVALIVLGPEKLPRVARTVGALLGRMQRYVTDVKADINREIDLSDLKKVQTEVKDAAQSFESTMRDMNTTIQGQVSDLNSSLNQNLSPESLAKAESDIAAQTTQLAAVAPELPPVDSSSFSQDFPPPVAEAVASTGRNQDWR